MIKLYQWFLSPFLGTACRFQPTCSVYATEAIKLHGIIKGSWLALKRILRCNPWGGSGYDPVTHDNTDGTGGKGGCSHEKNTIDTTTVKKHQGIM